MSGMRFILIRKTTGYVLCDAANEPIGFTKMSEADAYLKREKEQPEQWRIARLVPAKA